MPKHSFAALKRCATQSQTHPRSSHLKSSFPASPFRSATASRENGLRSWTRVQNQTAPLFGGAARIEVRGRSGLALERLHVFSLEAFGAIHQVELHGLASCKLRNPFERMAEKCTKTSAPELRLIKP